jgi:hypothetical protein
MLILPASVVFPLFGGRPAVTLNGLGSTTEAVMRTILLGLLAVGSLAGRAWADDEPRAVIDRAMKAMGGEARLAQVQAVETKIKGTLHAAGGLPFTADTFSQSPDQFRHAMLYDRGGSANTQIQVYSGDNVWIRVNDRLMDLDADLTAALRKGRYAESLTTLAMLKDKGYELTAAGEEQVEGRAATGVKVTARGRPDVTLFFDKASGLLVKTAHRQLDPSSRKEVLQEDFYSDYREPDAVAADEQVLKAAGQGTDGPSLVAYLRKQAQVGPDWDKLKALVRQLGDRSAAVREKAAADLVARGGPALPVLRQARKDPDPEIARQAERCLQQIVPALIRRLGHDDYTVREQASADIVALGSAVAAELRAALDDLDPEIAYRASRCLQLIDKGPRAAAMESVLWLVAVRKPAGAAEALLAYLPFAPTERLADEATAALAAVALADGKPDKAVEQALEDSDPIRKAAAAAALGKDGGAFARRAQHRLHLEGLKRPMKVIVTRDGAKFADWEVLEVRYFNKLDSGLFAKP